jgi:hypothetical protein
VSGFNVQPSALDTYANLLGSVKAPDAGATVQYQYLIDYSNYVSTHVELEGGGFIFALISDKITAINTQLGLDSSLISTNLMESAMGLNASADDYRRTDRAAAQRSDALWDAPPIVPLEDGTPGQPYVGAKSKLVEPSDEGVVPDLAQELLDAGGVFSESDLVIKILRWCGLDIIGWAGDKLAGDHKALARCKNALKALGEFDTTAGDDVANGAATMLTHWTGQAAGAATSAFSKTATGLRSHGTAVSGTASRMSALLVGMQEGMAALEGALTTALDRAIEAAAAVAAAGCLQEIPGVDVLADIIGGAEVLRVIHAVKEFFDIWNKVWAAHEGILGAIAGLIGGLSSWDVSSELPTIGYYNASQGPAPHYNSEPAVPHGGPR